MWSFLHRLVLLTLFTAAVSGAFPFTSLQTSATSHTDLSSGLTNQRQQVSFLLTTSRGGGKMCRQLTSGNEESAEEEEEEDPLANGIESVTWLPSVKAKQSTEKSEVWALLKLTILSDAISN